MKSVDELLKESEWIKKEYESHFKTNFPDQIIGWWDPVNIVDYPEELAAGVKSMQKDVKKAIKTNIPIKNMSNEEWNNIIF